MSEHEHDEATDEPCDDCGEVHEEPLRTLTAYGDYVSNIGGGTQTSVETVLLTQEDLKLVGLRTMTVEDDIAATVYSIIANEGHNAVGILLTPKLARQIAAALLNAADELEA